MGKYKYLFAGIVFLVFQLIIFLINGIPNLKSDAYSVGYLAGHCVTGIIGIVFLVLHFINSKKV